jgi:hypothetical protein
VLKKTIICALVFALLLGGILLWCAVPFYAHEPVYKGKSLSSWLQGYQTGANSSVQIEEAICSMGTNAVPLLLEWSAASDPILKRKIVRLVQRQPLIKINYVFAEQRQWQADRAFRAMRTCNPDIVTMLIGIYERTNGYRFNGHPFLILSAIGRLGAAGQKAVPLLAREAGNTNIIIRETALWALGQITTEPELAVPVLINALNDQSNRVRWIAVSSLFSYGSDAKEAIPMILKQLEDDAKISKPINDVEHRVMHGAMVQTLKQITNLVKDTNSVRDNRTNPAGH